MPSNPACLTRSRPFSNPHSLRIMLSPMAFFIARIIHSMNLAGDTRSLEPSQDGVDYGILSAAGAKDLLVALIMGARMDFDLDLTIAVLRRSPATLRALLDGLSESWIRGNEGPETFSPFDVVGHLIDGEETDWIPRARIILAKGESLRFEPYDRFRHKQRNAGRSPASLLKEFADLRKKNLKLLRSWKLTPKQL